jgi:hypothetical protein
MLNKSGFVRLPLLAVVTGLIFAANAFAQLPAPAVPGTPAPTAEVERVISPNFGLVHQVRGRLWCFGVSRQFYL